MHRPKIVNRRFSLKAHWKTILPYCTGSQNKLSWLELFLILEICLNGNCQVWLLLGAGQVILFHRGKRTSHTVWVGLRWCLRLLLRLSAGRCVHTACSRKGASPPEESLGFLNHPCCSSFSVDFHRRVLAHGAAFLLPFANLFQRCISQSSILGAIFYFLVNSLLTDYSSLVFANTQADCVWTSALSCLVSHPNSLRIAAQLGA